MCNQDDGVIYLSILHPRDSLLMSKADVADLLSKHLIYVRHSLYSTQLVSAECVSKMRWGVEVDFEQCEAVFC
jgi:hypothetical protein